MKFISIALKGLKETVRNRRVLLLLLLFPVVFTLVFGFAFGGMGGDNNSPHDIVVINHDTGTGLFYKNTSKDVNFGNNFTDVLADIKYENTDVNIFNINNTTEEEANQLLKDRKIDAIVIIPPDFSKATMAMINDTADTEITSTVGSMVMNGNTRGLSQISADKGLPQAVNTTATVIIKGDTGYINFGMTQGILVGVLEQYKDNVNAEAKKEVLNYFGVTGRQTTPNFIKSEVEAIPGTESFTTFDYIAPGMIIFALLLLATSVASTLAREVENGTLGRLKLTKMRSFDLLFGTLVPWSLIAIAQVIIIFIVAIMIGYHWQGDITSILLAIGIGIIGGVASVSLGLLIAAFSKNEQQAASLSTMIAVPLSFVAGAFFPLPKVVIGNLSGQPFQIYDILPWTHGIYALRSVLTFGGGWDQIAYDVWMMIALTVLLFAVGVVAFSKARLKAEY